MVCTTNAIYLMGCIICNKGLKLKMVIFHMLAVEECRKMLNVKVAKINIRKDIYSVFFFFFSLLQIGKNTFPSLLTVK